MALKSAATNGKGRIAEVYLIGQTKEGDPLEGKPPYYNNPTVILKADWMKHGHQFVENGGYRIWNLVDHKS